MRILHVSQPTQGGVARHVADLSRLHALGGHAVEVACPAGPLADELRRSGFVVHDVPLVRRPSPKNDLLALLRLVKLMAHGRYDLVATHSAKGGAVGRVAALLANKKATYTPHAWSFLAAGSRAERLLYVAIEKVLALVATNRIICVSTQELEEGRRTIGAAGKMRVVPNGVVVPQRLLCRAGHRAAAGAREVA